MPTVKDAIEILRIIEANGNGPDTVSDMRKLLMGILDKSIPLTMVL